MRIIPLDMVKPDMKLGRNIYDSEGRTLLSSGSELKGNYVRRLEELGITFIYVDDGRYGPIEIDDVVADETRREAIKEIRRVMVRVQGGEDFSARNVAHSVNEIIDELMNNRGTLVQMTDIRAMRDYTFAHSVAVAIAVLVTGIAIGYNQRQLSTLGIGALLHDLGKSLVPGSLIEKPGKLSPIEYEEMKRHAQLGFEALRRRDDISPVSASVAFQHHERYNGSGYPRGLSGNDIHEFARLTAIADVFDAMTTGRVYHDRHQTHEAVEFLTAGSGILFDPELTTAFLKHIALYPVGSTVRLSTQEVGVVVKNNSELPARPLVRVVSTDQYGAISIKDVDLARELTVFVLSVLSHDQAQV